jgi:hypothetical protein
MGINPAQESGVFKFPVEFSSFGPGGLLGKHAVRSFYLIGIGICLCGLLTGRLRADTFQLIDGQQMTGDIISANESGIILRLGDGKYSDRVPWAKLSQADLKRLKEKPKLEPFVDPFIEIPQEERVKKTEVVIKPVERLARPAKGSLLGALFGSSVGLVCLLLIYAANVYAGYQIAVVRAYSPALVCGVSAIAPFVGPIIFLSVPTRIVSAVEWKPGQARATAEVADAAAPVAEAATESGEAYPPTEAAAAAPVLPKTQVFQRGQFTFNRRFFETKFAGFFGLVRRDAEKDMVLVFKTSRGQYVASRITRIASNDLHVEVHKGTASHEVAVAFLEIQEIQLKHKDA